MQHILFNNVKYTSTLILITLPNSYSSYYFDLLHLLIPFILHIIYCASHTLVILSHRILNNKELNTASIPLQDICRVKPPVLLEPISLEELPRSYLNN